MDYLLRDSHHGAASLKNALGDAGTLPDPTSEAGRAAYLKIDDWFLFEHARSPKSRDAAAILQHLHDRLARETSEVASADELLEHDLLLKDLQENGMDAWSADASKSWYKSGSSEILIAAEASHSEFSRGLPLTTISETAGKIRDSKQRRIYVPHEMVEPAKARIKEQERGGQHGNA
jgi:hypothetical protein